MNEKVKSYFTEKPEHDYLMPADEAVRLCKEGADLCFLDIRSQADYEAGHLKGSINLPFGPAIADNLSLLPRDKEVILYCYSGQTAGQAVATLNIAGIKARSVAYGWNLGLAKVEGIKGVTETSLNPLPQTENPLDSEVLAAITDYYKGLLEVSDTTYKNYKVTEDNLKAMMEDGEDIYLVSNRKAEDYAQGHIKGAVHIPYGACYTENLADMPKDKKVVVYCYSGQTAGQSVAALRLMGYDAVSLNGGMGTPGNAPMGWGNKGYAVVK